MKKTIFCSIPMKEQLEACCYRSTDTTVPCSPRQVVFPINAFLDRTLMAREEVQVILLAKKDPAGHYRSNAEAFRRELEEINRQRGARLSWSTIETDFRENRSVHAELLWAMVSQLEPGTAIQADLTYGPKDLPIVLFTALHFGEKFLRCRVDRLLYGQADFLNGHPTNTRLCDLSPLYALNSVTEALRCRDPEQAKAMLEALLFL